MHEYLFSLHSEGNFRTDLYSNGTEGLTVIFVNDDDPDDVFDFQFPIAELPALCYAADIVLADAKAGR